MGESKGFRARGTDFREDEEEFVHESYGMVGISRCRGGGKRRLFGSSIKDHGTFISLRVKPGVRRHHLSMDWYSANSGVPLIEVHLSAAQFAEMITTMNVSDGVPCTIRYFDGKSVEDPPDEETEAEKVRTGFKEKTGALARRLGEFRAEMGRLFEKKAVGKGDREEVLKQVDLFIQEVRSNMPFVLDQFEEATEKVVTTAKAEVEAFTMHAVTSAGLLAIADGTALKALPEGLPRSPDGTINNCALANGDEESNCQMCGGECPDRHRFASEETCRLAREVKG